MRRLAPIILTICQCVYWLRQPLGLLLFEKEGGIPFCVKTDASNEQHFSNNTTVYLYLNNNNVYMFRPDEDLKKSRNLSIFTF